MAQENISHTFALMTLSKDLATISRSLAKALDTTTDRLEARQYIATAAGTAELASRTAAAVLKTRPGGARRPGR
jgi:hypothetical protein